MRFGRVPKREKAKILAAMQSSKAKVMESRVLAEMSDDRKIIDTIVRAHYDTCDYTTEKMKPFKLKAQTQNKLTQCTGQVGRFITLAMCRAFSITMFFLWNFIEFDFWRI